MQRVEAAFVVESPANPGSSESFEPARSYYPERDGRPGWVQARMERVLQPFYGVFGPHRLGHDQLSREFSRPLIG
jgi:hypothetical protein